MSFSSFGDFSKDLRSRVFCIRDGLACNGLFISYSITGHSDERAREKRREKEVFCEAIRILYSIAEQKPFLREAFLVCGSDLLL